MSRGIRSHAVLGRPGFTLVELLVVILIIAVLVALLVPVLLSSKGSAKVAGCLNNEKQITDAVLQYAQDYAGTTPPGVWGQDNGKVVTWDTLILKHLKNSKKVLKCPGDVTKGTRSYGINDQYIRRTQSFNGMGTPVSSVPSTTKFVIIAEFHNDESTIGGDKYAMTYFAPDKNEQYHDGGDNYAFFDGHVKYHKFGSITNDNFIFTVKDD